MIAIGSERATVSATAQKKEQQKSNVFFRRIATPMRPVFLPFMPTSFFRVNSILFFDS